MPSFEYTPFWHHQVSKFNVLASKDYRRPLIALFGDSITEGFQVHEFLSHHSFANRGISGDVTEAALLRLNDSLVTLKPDIVFMMIGTNDVGLGYSDEQILANYETMLSTLKMGLPSVKVVVQSILPTRSDPTRPNDRIRALNESLKTLSANHQCQYLDLHPYFADERGELSASFTLDGLHLNGLAYQVWADVLERVLKSL